MHIYHTSPVSTKKPLETPTRMHAYLPNTTQPCLIRSNTRPVSHQIPSYLVVQDGINRAQPQPSPNRPFLRDVDLPRSPPSRLTTACMQGKLVGSCTTMWNHLGDPDNQIIKQLNRQEIDYYYDSSAKKRTTHPWKSHV